MMKTMLKVANKEEIWNNLHFLENLGTYGI